MPRRRWRGERFADGHATLEEAFTQLRRVCFVGALALLALAATVGVLETARTHTQRSVNHSREVARLARQAQALAIDRETGIRGYLLTGDRQFLETELAARARLPQKLDSLATLTIDNRVQHRRALIAREAVDRWEREFAAPALAQPDRSSFTALIDAQDALYAKRVARERCHRFVADFMGIAGASAQYRPS